jgi:hypothetical protein
VHRRPIKALTPLEVCDLCGNATEEFIKSDGLIICKECAEEFDLKENSETFERCVFCGWPINRELPPEIMQEYFKIVKKWLEEKNEKEIARALEARMKNILNRELACCRYDFFDYMRGIIELFSPELAKEFEKKFVNNFDFQGGMIC